MLISPYTGEGFGAPAVAQQLVLEPGFGCYSPLIAPTLHPRNTFAKGVHSIGDLRL